MHLGSGRHHGQSKTATPFQEGSPFAGSSQQARLHRANTYVDPMDEEDHKDTSAITIHISEAPAAAEDQHERNTTLDGASEPRTPASKAEAWSNLYQQCVVQVPSEMSSSHYRTRSAGPATPASMGHRIQEAKGGMAPPALKPPKARSPEHPKGLDPHASVRRFPSVTVVDDRKGHGRSVSLISVKVGLDGVMRSSTNDLIDLIEARERQEREKLLRGPSRASTTAGVDA